MDSINLKDVGVKNAMRLMMENTEYCTFKDVAETLDISKSTFQSALDNNAIRVRDLQRAASLFGYEIHLVKK